MPLTVPDPERWTTEQIRVYLGAASLKSVSRTLHRLGVKAVAREPGKAGMNLYDAREVICKIDGMPRRAARTDLKEKQQ